MANVIAIAMPPPMSTRAAARSTGAPPSRPPSAPVDASNDERRAGEHGDASVDGAADSDRSGIAAPTAKLAAETTAACSGRAARRRGHAELVAEVRPERVGRGQLRRDLAREAGLEASPHVDVGELLELELGVCVRARSARARCRRARCRAASSRTRTRLRPSTSHRRRAPASPATAISLLDAVGGGDADHEAGRRDDAVVGAEHRGAQPADTAEAVPLPVQATDH